MSRYSTLLVLVVVLIAPVTAQKPYGSGTAGTAGVVPTLDAPQAWMGNANFEWRIDDALGGALAYLLVSAAPGSSFFNGTEILVDAGPGALLTVEAVPLGGPSGLPSFGSGSFAAPINLPVIPVLAGFSIYAQALILDFPTPGTLAATRGLESTFTLPPEIFIGSGHGAGSPYYVVDPVTSSIAVGSGNGNTYYAEYTGSGRDLYLGTSGILHANADSGIDGSTNFTTVYTPPNLNCGGLEIDSDLDIAYTVTGANNSQTRELVGVDIDPASGTFGVAVIQSSLNLAIGVDRWALSPDGKFAVLGRFPDFVVVDTDSNSLTFLQILATVTPPDVSFSLPTRVEITEDNTALIAFYEFSSGTRLGRYDLDTLSWIDHNPGMNGVQHIGPNSSPPAPMGAGCDALALACDSSFAMLTGAGNWLGRVDLTDKTGSGWSYSDFTDPNFDMRGDAVALSPDGETAAVCCGGNMSAGRPPVLQLVDTATGAVLQSLNIPYNGNMNVGAVTFR